MKKRKKTRNLRTKVLPEKAREKGRKQEECGHHQKQGGSLSSVTIKKEEEKGKNLIRRVVD